MERNIHIAIVFIFLLTLIGCTVNPFTTNNKFSGNIAGPIIGGAVGAGSMSLLGAPRAITELAAVGGAAIGYYVTTLRFDAGGVIQSGGQVYTIGEYITVEIPTDRLFDTNSAELLPEADPILQSAVNSLNHYPDDSIIISGNTSGFGTTRFERQLSQKRAQQVAGYLWAHGINNFNDKSITMNRKLTYVGYGSFFPIANNLHNDSIRSNSRIQITGYPCKAKLHLTKRQRVFTNIGDLDASPKTLRESRIDFNHEFPNETLPEANNGTHPRDFQALNETIPSAHNYREDTNFKGETWGNYKSESTAAQATSSSIAKQGGLKDELSR